MIEGEPSRTAFGAARHRALHQVLEGGRIFTDPLAWRILGQDPPTDPDELAALTSERRGLRVFIAARHRIAEDVVAEQVARGVRQVIVLGAGLDTFAYRHPHAGVTIFEVDFPATGRWKAELLQQEGLDAAAATFVGVDFEHDDLLTRLTEAGFDAAQSAVVMWLGVVPYLTPEAVEGTLRTLGRVPGATVVFDYPVPETADLDADARAARAALRDRVAAIGEPFRSAFDPADLARLLRDAGFTRLDDLDLAGIAARLGWQRPVRAGTSTGRIMIASR